MVWAMILGAAAITFLLRFSFLGTLQPEAIPRRARELLRFVPPAVLAAIVVPALAIRDGAIVLAATNPRPLAAAVALIVAWVTRSVIWTIAAGMAALWLAQWWLG
jgi:branched-subunit amino acid transport protein